MKLHILDLSPVRHVDLGFGTALNLKEGESSWHYSSDNHVMIVLFFPSPSRLIACPPFTVLQSPSSWFQVINRVFILWFQVMYRIFIL